MFIFNYALQPLRLILRSGLNVPNFATSRLHACHQARAPSGGRWNCGREVSGILPKCRLTRYIQGSFTCRKATTWDLWLYFPSEGKRAEDFFVLKIRRLRRGGNPKTWVPKTSTPPPDHRMNTELQNVLFILTSVYLLIVGVDGYCSTRSHTDTHTHTYKEKQKLGRTPLDEGSARRRTLYL